MISIPTNSDLLMPPVNTRGDYELKYLFKKIGLDLMPRDPNRRGSVSPPHWGRYTHGIPIPGWILQVYILLLLPDT